MVSFCSWFKLWTRALDVPFSSHNATIYPLEYVKSNGTITGLKVETIANLGAYACVFGTVTPTYLYAPLIVGLYDVPAAYCNVKAVVTNTAPVDAYRGAGRPEATYTIERLMDKAAIELGIDRAEFRKQNFVKKFPHQQCLVHNVDSGDYVAHLNKALELSNYKGFENRKMESIVYKIFDVF